MDSVYMLTDSVSLYEIFEKLKYAALRFAPIFGYYQLCKIHKLPVVYYYFQNSLFSSKHWVVMDWHLLSKYDRKMLYHMADELSTRKKPCPVLLFRIMPIEKPPGASLPLHVIAYRGDYTQGCWRP